MTIDDTRPLSTEDIDFLRREVAPHNTTIRRLLATFDAERARHADLVAAVQPILDRCLDFFGADDLDPESSEAMPVVVKNRWVHALRAALDGELEEIHS